MQDQPRRSLSQLFRTAPHVRMRSFPARLLNLPLDWCSRSPQRLVDLHDGLHVGEVWNVRENLRPVLCSSALEILQRAKPEECHHPVWCRASIGGAHSPNEINLLKAHAAPARFHERDVLLKIVRLIKCRGALVWIHHADQQHVSLAASGEPVADNGALWLRDKRPGPNA